MPLGAALFPTPLRMRQVVLAGAVTSGFVELIQLLQIGRYASILDIVANTGGTALGWFVASQSDRLIRPDPVSRFRLAVAAFLAAAAALSAPIVFLRWSSTDAAYYVQWAAELGHLDRWRGRVLAVFLAEQELPQGMARHSPTVALQLRSRARLIADVVAGERPSGIAPIVSIYDHLQREILLLGQHRDEIVWRHRTVANAAGLDAGAWRAPGLFEGIRPGDTIRIAVEPMERGTCIMVKDRETCGLGPRVTEGWTMIWYPDTMPLPLERAIGLLWVAGLLLPFAWWARPREAGAGAAVIALLFYAVPAAALAPATAAGAWLAAGAAITGGQVLGRLRTLKRP